MQPLAILINGRQRDGISSLDRGLLYGDGIFSTIAVNDGKPRYWQNHLQRLQLGCETLGLARLDDGLLYTEIRQLIDTDKSCVIKVIITRGAGSRGYKPGQQANTRIIQKFPWPEYPAHYTVSGVAVTLCELRLSHQPRLAHIKHLNRLEQVLARSEWDAEYQEGLVCDEYENIIAATSANVFFDFGEVLVTPDLARCGVSGVMRNRIIHYCNSHAIPVSIRDVKLDVISSLQGMFVCNSVIGIWPVRTFDRQVLSKTNIISELMAFFNFY